MKTFSQSVKMKSHEAESVMTANSRAVQHLKRLVDEQEEMFLKEICTDTGLVPGHHNVSISESKTSAVFLNSWP